jgi:colanic acid/amylovoran biosynthesis protein
MCLFVGGWISLSAYLQWRPRGAGAIKIVVTNQVALNTGDGAILIGLVIVLKRAFGDNIEIVVLDRYGSIPQRYYPEVTFKQAFVGRSLIARGLRRLGLLRLYPTGLDPVARDNLEQFRSADLVISAGGTYLVEHYPLELNLLQLSLAASTGTQTVMFTQSLGPFRKRAVKAWIRGLIPSLSAIFLRDGRSFENLAEIGALTDNVRIVPDAAFALANLKNPKPTRGAQDSLRVAISARRWSFPNHSAPDDADRTYRKTMSELVLNLVRRHKARVIFVSTCQGVPEYMFDDSVVAREIAASLPDDVAASVTVDSDFHRPETLRDDLAGFDLVIATRMHGAILGLCAGTPVLPIAYEFKTKELFQGLGLGEWVMDIASMEPEQCVGLLDRFVAKLEQIQTDIIPRIIEQHSGAMAVADELRAIVQIRREEVQ